MLLVTLCCLLLGIRQAYIVPYVRQANAVEQLAEAGASMQTEEAKPAWLMAAHRADLCFRRIHYARRNCEVNPFSQRTVSKLSGVARNLATNHE
jgi:hypothetical protein